MRKSKTESLSVKRIKELGPDQYDALRQKLLSGGEQPGIVGDVYSLLQEDLESFLQEKTSKSDRNAMVVELSWPKGLGDEGSSHHTPKTGG